MRHTADTRPANVATVTTREAAALLGVTAHAVRTQARRGRLPGARRVGRDWDVPASTVADLLARRSSGTPTTERTPA